MRVLMQLFFNQNTFLKVALSSLFLLSCTGCAEQVAQVVDIAHVTKDRGESYKTAMLQPSLNIPKEMKKESSPDTYYIP